MPLEVQSVQVSGVRRYLIFTIIAVVFALAINSYIIMHSCLNGMASGKASDGVANVVEHTVETITGDPNTINETNHTYRPDVFVSMKMSIN